MAELIEKYELSIWVSVPSGEIKKIITNLENIKIWEPSHRLPFVHHHWIPDEGRLQPGNLLIIKSPFLTFKAKCKEITPDTVKWEFIEGPLKGNEYWKIECKGHKKCRVIKIMDCRIYGFVNKTLWQIIGRKIHDWATIKQLKTIKYMAEKPL
jgi:hypothetical protein